MKLYLFSILIWCATCHGFKDPVDSKELSLLLVPGKGTIDITADQVEFEYSISTKCIEVDSMRSRIGEHLLSIQEGLTTIPDGKIQVRLGKLSVSAQERQGEPYFHVSKKVTIAVLDTSYLDTVTALMDRNNFLMNTQYWSNTEEEGIRDESYTAACADATTKARILAKELGVKIIGVHRIYTDGLGRKETGYKYGRPRDFKLGVLRSADGEGIMDFSNASVSSMASRVSIQDVTYITQLTIEFLIE